MSSKHLLPIFAGLLAASFGAGCADPTSDVEDGNGRGAFHVANPGTALSGRAFVRVVLASPDAQLVDVYADSDKNAIREGMRFSETTAYVQMLPGKHTFHFVSSIAPGKLIDTTASLDLADGTRVTAIAAGLAGSVQPSDSLRLLSYEESKVAPPATGMAQIHVVNASPDAPALAVDLGDDDALHPEIAKVQRFEVATATTTTTRPASNMQLAVVARAARVTAFTLPPVEAGADLLVIATGMFDKPMIDAHSLSLVEVGEEGTIGSVIEQNPILYAFAAVPDAPRRLDLFEGATKRFDALAFGQLSAPVQLPPGDHAFDVFDHADDDARPGDPPNATAKLATLRAGRQYLTVATGFYKSEQRPGITLGTFVDGFDRTSGSSGRVRLVHASPDAPALDFGIARNGKLDELFYRGLPFLGATEANGIAVGSSVLPLGLAEATDRPLLGEFVTRTLPEVRGFSIVAGAVEPKDGRPLGLFLVDTATPRWTVQSL